MNITVAGLANMLKEVTPLSPWVMRRNKLVSCIFLPFVKEETSGETKVKQELNKNFLCIYFSVKKRACTLMTALYIRQKHRYKKRNVFFLSPWPSLLF